MNSNLITEKLSNGNTINYRIIDGTAYHAETNDIVIGLLEQARKNRNRIRIFLGDTETGRDWGDRAESGRVGRSTGSIKIPLLILTSRSMGGGGIPDHCIIKIDKQIGKKYINVYRHTNYHKE
jgi:hypothetical protein